MGISHCRCVGRVARVGVENFASNCVILLLLETSGNRGGGARKRTQHRLATGVQRRSTLPGSLGCYCVGLLQEKKTATVISLYVASRRAATRYLFRGGSLVLCFVSSVFSRSWLSLWLSLHRHFETPGMFFVCERKHEETDGTTTRPR